MLQSEKDRRIYKIVSIKRVTTDYEHMKVDTKGKEHITHIEKLLDNSTQKRDVKFDENTNLLVLQTCTREKNIQALRKALHMNLEQAPTIATSIYIKIMMRV